MFFFKDINSFKIKYVTTRLLIFWGNYNSVLDFN